jgi:8-oxo-dGTP pyrophosphatase MutT (NUDIX family)
MVEQDGKLLFVEERSEGKVVLNQPAGHVEKGETLIEAAVRETLEESACEVKIKSVQGLYSHYYRELDITYYRFCFLSELIKHHTDKELDKDIISTCWLTPDEAIREVDRFRSPMVESCINDFVAGQFFPLTLLNEISHRA